MISFRAQSLPLALLVQIVRVQVQIATMKTVDLHCESTARSQPGRHGILGLD